MQFKYQRGAVSKIENQENVVFLLKERINELSLRTRSRDQVIGLALEHATRENPNAVICT